jgi:UDP-4-amino-4,6-dideoxy-N-acetyl-beta-L-altrosamine transaminase
MSVIPYGRQSITEEDVTAVAEVLSSTHLTQGPEIEKFELDFAKYVNSKFAVAVSNGTAALHLSVLALDLRKGDNVICSPITFVASANCVKYVGANLFFVDIDPDTYLLDIEKVEEIISSKPKGFFKGVIPIDFAGRAVDSEKLRALAQANDLWILEDACHAPGGFFVDSNGNAQTCGSGQFSDLSIFSFHPVKHIACGEGGMITTNNQLLYEKLLEYRTHGITRNSVEFENDLSVAWGLENPPENYPLWYMEMQTLGYNYRLTDIQAALGNSQLKRADKGIERRREIAKQYNAFFNSKDYIIRHSGSVEGHAYHLYVIEVEDRAGLYAFLREKKIFAQIHYFPVHQRPFHKNETQHQELIHSENYYKHCLSIPMFPSLSDSEIEFVLETIDKFHTA